MRSPTAESYRRSRRLRHSELLVNFFWTKCLGLGFLSHTMNPAAAASAQDKVHRFFILVFFGPLTVTFLHSERGSTSAVSHTFSTGWNRVLVPDCQLTVGSTGNQPRTGLLLHSQSWFWIQVNASLFWSVLSQKQQRRWDCVCPQRARSSFCLFVVSPQRSEGQEVSFSPRRTAAASLHPCFASSRCTKTTTNMSS